MKQKLNSTVWLYLGRRDKKGVKILTVLKGGNQSPTRIPDITILHLPPALERELKGAINDNRMLWEPWIESAESYAQLSESLKKRGFTHLPMNERPLCDKATFSSTPTAKTSNLPKVKIMAQRKR